MKDHYLKKTLALFLATVMIAGMVPVNIFAEETPAEPTPVEDAAPQYWKQGLEMLDWSEKFQKEAYDWQIEPKQKIIRTAAGDPLSMADFNYMGQYLDGDGRTVIRLELRMIFTAPSGPWHSVEVRFDEKLRQLIDINESAFYNWANEPIRFPAADDNGIYKFGNDVLLEGHDRFLGYGTGRLGHIFDVPVEVVLQEGKTMEDVKAATKGRDSYAQLRITDNAHVRLYARAYGQMPTDYSRYTLTAGIPVTDSSPSIFRKGEAIAQGEGNINKPLFVKTANLSADYNDVKFDQKAGVNENYYNTLSFQYSQRKDYVEDILKQSGVGNNKRGYKYGLAYIFDPVLLDFLKLPEEPKDTTLIGELKMFNDNGNFKSNIVVPIQYGNITFLDENGRAVDKARAKRAMVILRHASKGLELPDGYKPINVSNNDWNTGVISNLGNSHSRLNWYIDIDKMEDYVNEATGAAGGARYLNLNVNAGLLVENPSKWTDFVARVDDDMVINRQGFYITELSEPLVASPNTRNNQINIFFGSNGNQKVENFGNFAGLDASGGGFLGRTEGIQYGGPGNRYFSTLRASHAKREEGMLRRGRTVRAGDSIKVSLPNKTDYNGDISMYAVSPDATATGNKIYTYSYADPSKLWVGGPEKDNATKMVVKYADKNGEAQVIEAKKTTGAIRKWEATQGSFAAVSGGGFAYNPRAENESRGIEIDMTKSNWATDATVEFYENSTKLGTVTICKLPLDFKKVEQQYDIPTFAYHSDAETPVLIGKADYLPMQKLVFDDSERVEGYSRFQNAHVMLNFETLGESGKPGAQKTFHATSAYDEYDKEGNIIEKSSKGKDVKFEDKTYRAFPYTMVEEQNSTVTNKETFKDMKKRKDMPLYFSNNNSASLQSESKIERVHSKVTFDLNGGGKVATTEASLPTGKVDQTGNPVPRAETEDIVRIVPDNKYYLNDTRYDAKEKKLVDLPEGEHYTPNGFTGDNVQFIDQDTGESYKPNSEEMKLREMLDKDTVEVDEQGKELLGWSTVKGDYSVEAWNAMPEATTPDEVNDATTPHKFTSTSPVDRSMTVYAVYGLAGRAAENVAQAYDDETDTQKITGNVEDVTAERPIDKDRTVIKLVDEKGESINDKNGKPITTTVNVDGTFEFVINADNKEQLKGQDVHVVVQEPGKASAEKSDKVPLDLVGPTMGAEGDEANKIIVERDAYGYQVRITGTATDEAGILRLYAGDKKDDGYYDAAAAQTTATKEKQIVTVQNTGNDVTVTAIDKFGNKTIVTRPVEKVAEKLGLKLERPYADDDFIIVGTDPGANLTIQVFNRDGSEALTLNHTQKEAFDEVKLEKDGKPFSLTKGQKIKITGTTDGKASSVLNSRVR